MNFKNLFSAVGFTAVSLFATAQTTITNGGFETWTGSGQTVKPTQWHTTKSDMAGNALATSNAPQTIWDSTVNVHGGAHCIYIKTGNALGTTVNGSVTTGQIVAPTLTATDG